MKTNPNNGFASADIPNASSLGKHANDANVYRLQQGAGGIKREQNYRFPYMDCGYESQSITVYDSSFSDKKSAERINAIDALDYEIQRKRFELFEIPQTSFFLRRDLQKDIDRQQKRLDRLIGFDIEANRKASSKFVVLSNFPVRKRFQAKQLERARDAYIDSLQRANLCSKCLKPLRTFKAQVIRVTPDDKQLKRLRNGESLDIIKLELEQTAREYWNDLQSETTETTKGYSLESGAGIQKRRLRYRHIRVSNIEYADIKTHYQVFQYSDNGVTKFYYALIDGTMLNATMPMLIKAKPHAKLPNQLEYFTAIDGKEYKLYGAPQVSYRKECKACNCE